MSKMETFCKEMFKGNYEDIERSLSEIERSFNYLCYKNSDLNEIIDKAIEYLDSHFKGKVAKEEVQELLSILNGDDE